MVEHYHSPGKLLLTSEFLVIDGAEALALPCKYGQNMEVEAIDEAEIIWESYTDEGKLWYDAVFSLTEGKIQTVFQVAPKEDPAPISQRLEQVLNAILKIAPQRFQQGGYIFKNRLEFPREWGLGTSSTLLANLAKWAKINPYELAEMTFGGSAYDLACAYSSQPIVYQRLDPLNPHVKAVDFKPEFRDFLFFVYLNEKQSTQEMVAHYRNLNPADKAGWIKKATLLTQAFLKSKDLLEFEKLMDIHEYLLAEVLALPPVKRTLFPDFPRSIKSLGAWGGDFVLATGGTDERQYFIDKGYTTLIRYDDMVL